MKKSHLHFCVYATFFIAIACFLLFIQRHIVEHSSVDNFFSRLPFFGHGLMAAAMAGCVLAVTLSSLVDFLKQNTNITKILLLLFWGTVSVAFFACPGSRVAIVPSDFKATASGMIDGKTIVDHQPIETDSNGFYQLHPEIPHGKRLWQLHLSDEKAAKPLWTIGLHMSSSDRHKSDGVRYVLTFSGNGLQEKSMTIDRKPEEPPYFLEEASGYSHVELLLLAGPEESSASFDHVGVEVKSGAQLYGIPVIASRFAGAASIAIFSVLLFMAAWAAMYRGALRRPFETLTALFAGSLIVFFLTQALPGGDDVYRMRTFRLGLLSGAAALLLLPFVLQFLKVLRSRLPAFVTPALSLIIFWGIFCVLLFVVPDEREGMLFDHFYNGTVTGVENGKPMQKNFSIYDIVRRGKINQEEYPFFLTLEPEKHDDSLGARYWNAKYEKKSRGDVHTTWKFTIRPTKNQSKTDAVENVSNVEVHIIFSGGRAKSGASLETKKQISVVRPDGPPVEIVENFYRNVEISLPPAESEDGISVHAAAYSSERPAYYSNTGARARITHWGIAALYSVCLTLALLLCTVLLPHLAGLLRNKTVQNTPCSFSRKERMVFLGTALATIVLNLMCCDRVWLDTISGETNVFVEQNLNLPFAQSLMQVDHAALSVLPKLILLFVMQFFEITNWGTGVFLLMLLFNGLFMATFTLNIFRKIVPNDYIRVFIAILIAIPHSREFVWLHDLPYQALFPFLFLLLLPFHDKTFSKAEMIVLTLFLPLVIFAKSSYLALYPLLFLCFLASLLRTNNQHIRMLLGIACFLAIVNVIVVFKSSESKTPLQYVSLLSIDHYIVILYQVGKILIQYLYPFCYSNVSNFLVFLLGLAIFVVTVGILCKKIRQKEYVAVFFWFVLIYFLISSSCMALMRYYYAIVNIVPFAYEGQLFHIARSMFMYPAFVILLVFHGIDSSFTLRRALGKKAVFIAIVFLFSAVAVTKGTICLHDTKPHPAGFLWSEIAPLLKNHNYYYLPPRTYDAPDFRWGIKKNASLYQSCKKPFPPDMFLEKKDDVYHIRNTRYLHENPPTFAFYLLQTDRFKTRLPEKTRIRLLDEKGELITHAELVAQTVSYDCGYFLAPKPVQGIRAIEFEDPETGRILDKLAFGPIVYVR